MDPTVSEWFNIVFRWLHVYAGILWIGSTAFFSWLDARMSLEKDLVWMVHSGGFYRVEKHKALPSIPPVLHWFKWSSFFTWLSGFLLLGLMFYHGSGLLADSDALERIGAFFDAGERASAWIARAIGLGSLIAGFAVYEGIWSSPLGKKQETLAVAVSFAALTGLAYALTLTLSPRAAYIHVGAVLGTIMTANVWMRILPGQRQMIEAVSRGAEPDLALGTRAKARSKHNTFMAIPVVFTMISNHYPVATYGHRLNWAILAGLFVVGACARKLLSMYNLRNTHG